MERERDLRDGENGGREREAIDVGGGVAEQGVLIELEGRVDSAEEIGRAIHHCCTRSRRNF